MIKGHAYDSQNQDCNLLENKAVIQLFGSSEIGIKDLLPEYTIAVDLRLFCFVQVHP